MSRKVQKKRNTLKKKKISMKNLKKLMYISIIGTFLSGFLGFVFGVLSRSRAILFDGLYSIVDISMSLITYKIISFIAKENIAKEHIFVFGRSSLQPLVLLVKSFVLIISLTLAIKSAFSDILYGGRSVNLDVSIIYTVISFAISFAIYKILNETNKKTTSDLLALETLEWKVDWAVSLIAFLTFGTGIILKTTQHSTLKNIVGYLDSVLLIGISILFTRESVLNLFKGFSELLRIAPEREITQEVAKIVKKIQKKYRIKESFFRVSKVGTTLYIEVDYITSKRSFVKTIKDSDKVREELHRELKKLPYELWLTVSFTQDRKWAL